MDSGCLIGLLINLFMIFVFFKFLMFILFTPIGLGILLIWILLSSFGGRVYTKNRNEQYYRNWEEAYRQYRNSQYQSNTSNDDYNVKKNMKILGITELSKSAVKNAFRRLSKKYHPDVCKEDRDVCESIYKDITSAYESLMDYMSANNIN